VGQEARRAAQAGADVEHGHAGRDGHAAGQGLDGAEAAVVILIPRPQILRLERTGGVPAQRARGLQNQRRVDGVTVVESTTAKRGGTTQSVREAA
jgi:hypothetical protein